MDDSDNMFPESMEAKDRYRGATTQAGKGKKPSMLLRIRTDSEESCEIPSPFTHGKALGVPRWKYLIAMRVHDER